MKTTDKTKMSIDEQITAMIEAKDSHQQWHDKLIKEPEFDSKLVGDAEYQLKWVKIYDNVIESLNKLKHEKI